MSTTCSKNEKEYNVLVNKWRCLMPHTAVCMRTISLAKQPWFYSKSFINARIILLLSLYFRASVGFVCQNFLCNQPLLIRFPEISVARMEFLSPNSQTSDPNIKVNVKRLQQNLIFIFVHTKTGFRNDTNAKILHSCVLLNQEAYFLSKILQLYEV